MMKDRVSTIKIDIDTSSTSAADYGIRSVPTLMLVKDDEIIDQRVGGLAPTLLMQWLEQHI